MLKLVKTASVMGIAVVASVGIMGCEIEQTEEGSLPDVDLSVEGGNMPEYDVETADVEVEYETREVQVPVDVDVVMPDEQDGDR